MKKKEKPEEVVPAAPSSPSQKPPPMMFKALTHEQIAQRAYELYMNRKGAECTPEADWVKAELELREKLIDRN